VTSITDRADAYWASVFQTDRADLRRPGLHVTFVDDPDAGIYVLRLGDTVRVRAPETRRTQVDGLTAGLSLSHALDGAAWRAALHDADPVILGPAAHFLTGTRVGSVTDTAHPSDEDMRRMTTPIAVDEVEESGVLESGVERFGLWIDDAVAAVSSLSNWVGGRTDIGVLVAPHARGRGLGRAVATIAVDAAIRRAGIARWRCREDNTASMRLASSLGLQPYGRNLGIRLLPLEK
jgi:GNAT superfamily N-acetyltransferase